MSLFIAGLFSHVCPSSCSVISFSDAEALNTCPKRTIHTWREISENNYSCIGPFSKTSLSRFSFHIYMFSFIWYVVSKVDMSFFDEFRISHLFWIHLFTLSLFIYAGLFSYMLFPVHVIVRLLLGYLTSRHWGMMESHLISLMCLFLIYFAIYVSKKWFVHFLFFVSHMWRTRATAAAPTHAHANTCARAHTRTLTPTGTQTCRHTHTNIHTHNLSPHRRLAARGAGMCGRILREDLRTWSSGPQV